MGLINQFKQGGGGVIGSSTSTTTTTGGTSGTLGTQGYYSRQALSNQGLNTGTRSVADNLAYNRSVQPEGMVENRLIDLIDRDSAYMQQATRGAERMANSRGLLNSSIAAGNARAASVSAAMPIAAADANSINAAETQNLDALNAAGMQERALINEATIARGAHQSAQGAYEAGQQEALRDRQHQLQMQRERLGFEGEQAELGRLHNFGIMDRDYRQ
jgi:hypothetical protein